MPDGYPRTEIWFFHVGGIGVFNPVGVMDHGRGFRPAFSNWETEG